MKALTKKRLSRKGKALQRSASSWNGAYRLLQLLSRADVNEDSGVGAVVANFYALELLSQGGKI